MPRIPQYKTPFQIVDGIPAEVEQDSVEEIEQCVEAILRTFDGTLLDDTALGIPDETFVQQTPAPSADVYLAAVEAAEPRARLVGSARLEELVRKVTTIEAEDAVV